MTSTDKTSVNEFTQQGRDPDSARDFRQQVNAELREEFRRLSHEHHEKEVFIAELSLKVKQLERAFEDYKRSVEEPLNAARAVANATWAGKQTIWFILQITALFGGVVMAYHQISEWVGHK